MSCSEMLPGVGVAGASPESLSKKKKKEKP